MKTVIAFVGKNDLKLDHQTDIIFAGNVRVKKKLIHRLFRKYGYRMPLLVDYIYFILFSLAARPILIELKAAVTNLLVPTIMSISSAYVSNCILLW